MNEVDPARCDRLEDSRATETLCPRKKCGEFNMLKCVCERGHRGDCVFVVDYPLPQAREQDQQTAQAAGEKA